MIFCIIKHKKENKTVKYSFKVQVNNKSKMEERSLYVGKSMQKEPSQQISKERKSDKSSNLH